MSDAGRILDETGVIYVCAVCGEPVETEPCAEHQPKAYRKCMGITDERDEGYTPDAAEVRFGHAMRRSIFYATSYKVGLAEFDRWLAAERAQAWSEGYWGGRKMAKGITAKNPYRER